MTIDLRILSQLTPDFYQRHPGLSALDIAADADLDGNHQLNVAQIGPPSQQISINETEYNLYRYNLLTRSLAPETPQERGDALQTLLNNPQACVQSFLSEKQAGRLRLIEAEAQSWLARADQALQQSLSLETYFQTPQNFQAHIPPNYYRNLATVASYDRDGNQEVSLEEVMGAIQSAIQARIRQAEQNIERGFNEADSNHDHKVSLEELKAAEHVDSQNAGANARAEEYFNRVDSNHNHELDLSEFRASQQMEIPTEEDYRSQAQILLLAAHAELGQARERLSRHPENFREMDRLSSRLSTFNLDYLSQLDTATRNGNNLFRILGWMQSQNRGQNLLTHRSADGSHPGADELLETPALDIRPLIGSLSVLLRLLGNNSNVNRDDAVLIQNFIERFNSFPQHILTEDDLRLRVLSREALSIGELNGAVRRLLPLLEGQIPPPLLAEISRNIESSLGPLASLAGEDRILTREEIDALLARRRLSIVFRSIQNEVQNREVNAVLSRMSTEISEGRLSGTVDDILIQLRSALSRVPMPLSTLDRLRRRNPLNHLIEQIREEMRKPERNLQAYERAHFLAPLWTQFDETKIANPNAQVYTLTENEPYRKIDGNQFLARALIQYAYLNPSNILQTLQETERLELFYLIEIVAEGVHQRARSHASDLIPGQLNFLSHPMNWVGGLLFRERVARNADAAHEQRLEALQSLRATLANNSSYHSLREAITHLENPEHRRILTQELHVEEVERIYYIPNSREQEIAYTRFATYTLRGQVNPENGILAAFRSRFAINNIHSAGDLALNHLQFRNGPAAATFYDRLNRYSEHAQIQDQVRATGFDLRGNAGDLNPLHWNQNFSDDEASLDGIWDTLGGQAMLFAGGAAVLGLLRAGFGLGGVVAQSRFFTGLEFALGWRNHPNRWLRYLYVPARAVNSVYTLPLHRQLSAAEVEIVNANVLRYAQNVQWGRWGNVWAWRRFPGFVNNQRASLEAGRLLFDRNPQEAAARILRLSQIMLREAESYFALAHRRLTLAQRLANQGDLTSAQLTRIEAALRAASNASRQGHSLEQIAIQQRSSLGTFARPLNPSTGLPQHSEAYQRLQASLTGTERIPENLRRARAANKITGAQNIEARIIDARIQNIETYLARLQHTHTAMQGLTAHQTQLLTRGALAAGGLYGLARLTENVAASQAAARMINPAMVMAQNPLMQGGNGSLYFLAWQAAHQQLLTDEYRSNPTLQEWALENGIASMDMAPEQLQGAYEAQRRYRGSRWISRNVFLSPVRERDEREVIRGQNLSFPVPGTPSPDR